jgi:hypothetical protein
VVANFGAYVNKKNPIRVTIITRWGSSIPAGRILMEEETGGDPIFLVPCEVDSVTREFNVPCVLPEIVHGTSADGNLTTYNSILFVANDVHFARRLADGTIVYIDPPAAPTNVAATPTAFGAKVTWKAPTVTNGAAVTGYVVTAISGGVVKKTVTLNSAVLTTTVTGLAAGTTYGFRVVAKNVAGPGPPSAISNLIKPISPPGAPTGVTATAGAGQATVRWTAPTVTNGGAVTGYTVTVWSAGSLIKTMPSTTALTLTVTALNRGQNYGFKVAARNVAGLGPASAFSNIIQPT